MRFEGSVEDVGDGRIYDNNLCVWEGFACGLNYQDAENLDPNPMNDPKHDEKGDCSESTGLLLEDVYRKVRGRTFEPGGPHDVRSR
jgi:hypothetical protein